jgi:hypothetical protein
MPFSRISYQLSVISYQLGALTLEGIVVFGTASLKGFECAVGFYPGRSGWPGWLIADD